MRSEMDIGKICILAKTVGRSLRICECLKPWRGMATMELLHVVLTIGLFFQHRTPQKNICDGHRKRDTFWTAAIRRKMESLVFAFHMRALFGCPILLRTQSRCGVK